MDLATDEPVPGALVSLLWADTAVVVIGLSDPDGNFSLRVARSDSVRLRVERLGYLTTESVSIVLGASDTLRLEIRLRPQPVELEGVTATASLPVNHNLAGFLKRQRNGFGRYLGPGDLATISTNNSTDVIFRLDGARFQLGSHGSIIARGFGSGGPNLCIPRVYLDGVQLTDTTAINPWRMTGGTRIDGIVIPSELRAVEIYRNSYQAPAQFQTAFMRDCPVVVLWTVSDAR
jgi:hypothetical protein